MSIVLVGGLSLASSPLYISCGFCFCLFIYFLLLPLSQTLPEALTVLCEILSPDLEGGPARIDLDLFEYLYRFLATLGGEISKNQMDTVMEFLSEES